MIFRRRHVRIEIEHTSLRLATVTETAGFGSAVQPESDAGSLPPKNVPPPQAEEATATLSRKQETR